MQQTENKTPIETLHLFSKLDALLIDVLQGLTIEEWHKPTIAKLWTVKDIAAHLLDGNLRTLSMSRDGFFTQPNMSIESYADLVSYLNLLNKTWVDATKRLSPQVLIQLLQSSGKDYIVHLQSLPPFKNAIFSVAWAGESVSANWFHIAREYTEKFIHQQQIRDAVGKQALLTRELFYPFVDTLMCGLPHTFRNTNAPENTIITVEILTEIGGRWNLVKTKNKWQLHKDDLSKSDVVVKINPYLAWKIFSKAITPSAALPQVEIIGNLTLGKVVLELVAFMA